MVTFSHHYNWSISLELAKSPLNSIEIRFGVWKSNQSGIDFSCVWIEFNLIYRHITICIEWDQLEFQKRYSVLFIHLEYIYLTVCSFWIVEYSDRFSVRFRFESGSFFLEILWCNRTFCLHWFRFVSISPSLESTPRIMHNINIQTGCNLREHYAIKFVKVS